MTKYLFKLKDQTIVLLVFLLFFVTLLTIREGWQGLLLFIGAILIVPLLIKFLVNPSVELVGLLRKRYSIRGEKNDS